MSRFVFTKRSWMKYGLSLELCMVDHSGSRTIGEHNHDLVANYLDNHPEICLRYKSNQKGELGYFDVLNLAEKERGKENGR